MFRLSSFGPGERSVRHAAIGLTAGVNLLSSLKLYLVSHIASTLSLSANRVIYFVVYHSSWEIFRGQPSPCHLKQSQSDLNKSHPQQLVHQQTPCFFSKSSYTNQMKELVQCFVHMRKRLTLSYILVSFQALTCSERALVWTRGGGLWLNGALIIKQ